MFRVVGLAALRAAAQIGARETAARSYVVSSAVQAAAKQQQFAAPAWTSMRGFAAEPAPAPSTDHGTVTQVGPIQVMCPASRSAALAGATGIVRLHYQGGMCRWMDGEMVPGLVTSTRKSLGRADFLRDHGRIWLGEKIGCSLSRTRPKGGLMLSGRPSQCWQWRTVLTKSRSDKACLWCR